MKRLILLVLGIALVTAVSAGAWMIRGDEERRLGATGSAFDTCPPWAPILRVNAFGKKYCSAYDSWNRYVGQWASLEPAQPPCYRNPWRPDDPSTDDCCPDWAPVILPGPKCSRYDSGGRLYSYNDPNGRYQGLYPAAPQPPKPS